MPGPLAAGANSFEEPVNGDGRYMLRYGIGWQLADERIEPFTVTVVVDLAEMEQQTSSFRLGLLRSLGAARGLMARA